MRSIDGAMCNSVTEDGLHFEPSTKAARNVHMRYPYRQMLESEKLQEIQSTLDAFFKNRADSYSEVEHSLGHFPLREASLVHHTYFVRNFKSNFIVRI